MCGEFSHANRHKLDRFVLGSTLLVAHKRPSTHNSIGQACCRKNVCCALVVPMYSLRTQEKLDAERNQNSSRELLWKHLNDKKKSGRMVRRIYNKTRCVFGAALISGRQRVTPTCRCIVPFVQPQKTRPTGHGRFTRTT